MTNLYRLPKGEGFPADGDWPNGVSVSNPFEGRRGYGQLRINDLLVAVAFRLDCSQDLHKFYGCSPAQALCGWRALTDDPAAVNALSDMIAHAAKTQETNRERIRAQHSAEIARIILAASQDAR